MGRDSYARLYIGFEVARHAISKVWTDDDHREVALGDNWVLSYNYPYYDCEARDMRFYIHYKINNKTRPHYQNEQLRADGFGETLQDALAAWPALQARCTALDIPIDWSKTSLHVMAVAHES